MKAAPKHSSAPKAADAAAPDPHRCQFLFADGRRCRMPRCEGHRSLCRNHAQRDDSPLAAGQLAGELASLSGEFKTSSDVNHVLGKLWNQFSRGRLPRRDAVALAYIGQLLLQSVPSVRSEIRQTLGYDAWTETLRTALAGPGDGGEPDESGESSDEG